MSTTTEWQPEQVPQLTVDVFRSGDIIYVISTVAGVSPQDLDIGIDGNVLTIRGIRKKPYSENESEVLLNECFWGEFYRELIINEKIEIQNIRAKIENGVLIVEIPIMKVVTRKISVELGA
jgi:HSP20 family protein